MHEDRTDYFQLTDHIGATVGYDTKIIRVFLKDVQFKEYKINHSSITIQTLIDIKMTINNEKSIAFKKVMRSIQSCRNEQQLTNSINLIANYINLHYACAGIRIPPDAFTMLINIQRMKIWE